MNNTSWFSRYIKKGTVFTSWIILFFVLVMVAFIIMGIYFYSMNAALERNLEAYSTVKTEQISAELDAAATRLSVLANNIVNDFSAQKDALLHYHDTRSELLSELAIQLEMNRDIFGIYIFLNETNELVSGQSIVKEKYFYSGYFDTNIYSYSEWKQFLQNDDSDYFCLFPFLDTVGTGSYKLTYVLNPEDGPGKILVALNSESVMAGDPYFSKLIIADKGDELYSVCGKADEETEMLIKELQDKEGLIQADNNSYVTRVSSDKLGLKYYIFMEKSVLNKDLKLLQAFSFLYLLIFLIAGLALAWYFSLRQYKPLSGILDILKNTNSDVNTYKSNEYTKIKDSISDMQKEKAALMREAHKSMIYLKERTVTKLLNGRATESEIKDVLKISSGLLTVVRVSWNENKSEQFKEDFELQQFAVKNIAEEIFSKLAEVHTAASEMAGTVNLLLIFKDGTDNIEERLREAAEIFVDVMKTQLGIETDIVLGRLTESIDRISMVYSEMLETSLLCSDSGEIIEVSVMAERETEMYSYSIQTEIEIIFCIKKGDYAGAYNLINRELNEVLYRKNYPIYMIRCLMIEFAGTILKAVGEIDKGDEEIVLNSSSNVGKLFSATTIAEMELLVREFLKEVCDFVIEANTSISSSSVCEDIKQYVREHYADAEMNVNAIAGQFYLNSAYLSNMFKRNTGIKLLEYINKVRIDEAKKLMIQNPHISIEEVAEKSGFGNSRTFRRIFLKYENTSPSKFLKT